MTLPNVGRSPGALLGLAGGVAPVWRLPGNRQAATAPPGGENGSSQGGGLTATGNWGRSPQWVTIRHLTRR
ncbi:MAG TPA: hypothetical protein PKH77_00530 [Anaerolineae bacterium]|nr:hypothetical protein [Anaerolineae bacterium]